MGHRRSSVEQLAKKRTARHQVAKEKQVSRMRREQETKWSVKKLPRKEKERGKGAGGLEGHMQVR